MHGAFHARLFHGCVDQQVTETLASALGGNGKHAQKGIVSDVLDGHACCYLLSIGRGHDQKLRPHPIERRVGNSGAVEKLTDQRLVARPCGAHRIAQLGQQKVVQASIVARAHDDHRIAGRRATHQVLGRCLGSGDHARRNFLAAQIGSELLHIQPLAFGNFFRRVKWRQHHLVRAGECLREVVLEDRPSACRRARLEGDDQFARTVAALKRTQGLANRGRMVGKIVDHRHAVGDAAHFLTALDPQEMPGRTHQLRHFDAEAMGRRNHAGEILHVEDACHPRVEGEHALAFERQAQDRATAHLSTRDLECPLRVGARPTVRGDLAMRALRHLERARRRCADHEISVGRNELDEFAERPLDRRLVGEDVGVVELDRGENHQLWPVMEKLRLLVEESRVVFVAFDDEVETMPEPPRTPEINGHAADEKRWIAPGLGKHEGHQRRRRGLAMRSGDDDRVAVGQKQLGQERRERGQRYAARLGRQNLHVIAAAHVAHHDPIGLPREVLGGKPDHHGNSKLLELGRHGRIHVLVGAAHVMAGGPQKPGQGTHSSSGDTYQMQFHKGAYGLIRHSDAPGGNCGANFRTSSENVVSKSRSMPPSCASSPPEVPHLRPVTEIEPHASRRPRFRLDSQLSPHARAWSRSQPRSPAPHSMSKISYQYGPAGPYSAMCTWGTTPRRCSASWLSMWKSWMRLSSRST